MTLLVSGTHTADISVATISLTDVTQAVTTRTHVGKLNLCPATPIYIRLQADFKPNNISLKWKIYCSFVVDAQAVK